MALVDNFNSYTNGDLNGQGSWSGDIQFDVQGSVVQEGSKAISVSPDGTNSVIVKPFTALANGSQIFYIRGNATDKRYTVILYDSSTPIFQCGLAENGQIRILETGDTWNDIQAYSADTWYRIEIEWRVSDHSSRLRVNNGTWTSWYVGANTSWGTIDKAGLGIWSGSSGGIGYFDNFNTIDLIDVNDSVDITENVSVDIFDPEVDVNISDTVNITENLSLVKKVFTELNENFDSYTNGDLNGQGEWFGDIQFDVQGSVVQSGLKAVSAVPDGTNSKVAILFIDKPNGIITGYLRSTLTDKRCQLAVSEDDGGQVGIVDLHNNGQITFFGDGIYRNIQAYSADTWYKVDLEWRASDNKFRARVDNGAWTIWREGLLSFDIINTGIIDIWSGSTGGTVYWDNISTEDAEFDVDVNDTVSITENIIINIVEAEVSIDINDSMSITENIDLENVLNINVSDQLNITENTSIVKSSDINVSDDINIAENTDILESSDVNVNDSISITENIGLLITELFIDINDVVDIDSSRVTVVFPPDLALNLDDDIAITEDVQLNLEDLNIDVSDNVNISEDIILEVNSFVDVNDKINITEDEIVDIVREISVNDLISITENVDILVPELFIDVNEQLNITELVTITKAGNISIGDDIDIAEDIQIEISESNIDVSDQINITENVDIIKISVIDVNDSININENLTLNIPLEISVSDIVNITEDINIVRISPGEPNVSESEDINITELISLDISESDIDVNDSISVTENIDIATDDVEINVSDLVNITENTGQVLTEFFVNISDDITISEDETVDIDADKLINISDSITISENISIIRDLGINVNDSITVTDTILNLDIAQTRIYIRKGNIYSKKL